MARQMKEMASNGVMTAARIVPVGGLGPEAEEAGETEKAEQADSSLEARLERLKAEAGLPFTETELADRERTRERARAAVDRIRREDAERSARESEGTMSEEGMMESAGVGIAYVADEGGKLVKRRARARTKTSAKRRTSAHMDDDIPYVKNENGELVPYVPPPSRPFTQQDQERIDCTRDRRHTRRWFEKRLLEIHEGRVKVSRVEYHAFVTFGRMRGWTRRPPAKR